MRVTTILLTFVLGLCAAGARTAQALDAPAAAPHPRLWYGDPARLARARAFHAQEPVPIPGYPLHAQARNLALRHLMTGNAQDCASAIALVMRYDFELPDEDGNNTQDPGQCNFSAQGRYCDRARWGGEDAILTYDWCHDSMTASQRTAFIERWNRYIGHYNGGPYGWQHRPINNYSFGYLRNSLLWGIASAGENPRAQEFVDHALDVRFAQYFVPWALDYGVGGVSGEGTQYGEYPLGYSVIGFRSAADFGHDPYAQTPFFDHAVYYLAYATSPAPTHHANPPVHELFPLGDDQFFRNGASANRVGYADFLGAQILRAPGSPRARHARAWLARTGAQPNWWIRAELAQGGASGDDEIPDDYYAAGYGVLYTRSSDRPATTSMMLQLGAIGPDELGGVEHNGYEAGSFQIWHAGRFLSRESAGYRGSDYVQGLGAQGRVSIEHPIAHNTVLFEGNGQLGSFEGKPNVLRLQSDPKFAYIAADLRPAYRTHAGPVPSNRCWLAQDDWPFAEVAIRELVHLRDWGVLVALDRLRSGSDSLLPVYADPCSGSGYEGPRRAAADVAKTFVMHFPTAPQWQGGRASATAGGLAIDDHVLLPAGNTPTIVDERACDRCAQGQFRIELTQSGSADSYFLNVIHARDADEAPLQATLTEVGDGWRVRLQRADGGTAELRFRSGMSSVGGDIAFDGAAPVALRDDVQPMTVEPEGPVWHTGPLDRMFADHFE